ncbi:hypothetical protein [Nocardia sp. NPDC004604]|uniref:hypothetical protein n=1 Tax=Nocardia sp. NPDC004604 TaxID=3157013 RepID=UPI0033ABA254
MAATYRDRVVHRSVERHSDSAALPQIPGSFRHKKVIEMAAAQLGHASSVTTRRHYVEPAHEGPDARKHLDDFADLS